MITEQIINDYKKLTAEYFEIDQHLIFSLSRKSELIEPRRFLINYIRDKYQITLKNVGKHFSGIDHSTVLHHLKKHNDYLDTDSNYNNLYTKYISFMNFKKDLFADNADLSFTIHKFENKEIVNNDYELYYNELIAILNHRNIEINVYDIIRNLLLKSKVSEYTLNNNRLYSFVEIANLVLKDERTVYLKDVLNFNQIIEIGFVILQAKHIASINKIRIELESTTTELILEKYVDCLNYYILYEMYLEAL